MINNVYRTTIEKDVSECNAVYITTHGNQEIYISALANTFANIFFYETPTKTWNKLHKKPINVHTVPLESLVCNIDFVIFDDIIRGFDEAIRIAKHFQSPLVYMDFTEGDMVIPSQSFIDVPLDDNQKKTLDNRYQLCSKIKYLDDAIYVDESSDVYDHTCIVIDNFCDESFIQNIIHNLPKKDPIYLTDEPNGQYNNKYGSIFINTWNFPTSKTFAAMKSGSVIFYFPSDANDKVFKTLYNGVRIEDITKLKEYVDMILYSDDLRKSISENALETANNSNKDLSKIWNSIIKDHPYFRG